MSLLKQKWEMLIVLSLLLTFQTNCKKSDEMHMQMNVWAEPSLNVRDRPDGKIVSMIDFGEQVRVVGSVPGVITVDTLQGQWVKIKYGNEEGFVFSGYLSRLPVPAKDCKSLYDYYKRSLTVNRTVSEKGTRYYAGDVNMVSSYQYAAEKNFHENALYVGYAAGNTGNTVITLSESFYLYGVTLHEVLLLIKRCQSDLYEKYNRERKYPITMREEGGVLSAVGTRAYREIVIKMTENPKADLFEYGGKERVGYLIKECRYEKCSSSLFKITYTEEYEAK